MIHSIADLLAVLAGMLILVSAIGLVVYFGRLRRQLKSVDPKLYYEAGFDASTIFAFQGAGPPGVQRFLTGREFEGHSDMYVRAYALNVMRCRDCFLFSFALLVISGVLRIAATF